MPRGLLLSTLAVLLAACETAPLMAPTPTVRALSITCDTVFRLNPKGKPTGKILAVRCIEVPDTTPVPPIDTLPEPPDTVVPPDTIVPPPEPPVGYAPVLREDWSRFSTRDELRATGWFWWYLAEDVHPFVEIVPDPTFGQAVRYHFKQSDTEGYAPKSHISFAPLDHVWVRWTMKYTPGWTTVGPYPTGHANSYKVAFLIWENHGSRASLEISNTDQYLPGFGVQDPNTGAYIRATSETLLPGSVDFGRVTTEWTDNQWYEFVMLYRRVDASTVEMRWYRRRLTASPGAWTFRGARYHGMSETPRVRAVRLGETKNKSNPADMWIAWGPFEVVDGSQYPDPYGLLP